VCKDLTWLSQGDDFEFEENKNQQKRKMPMWRRKCQNKKLT
jgi:hypothetical protein